MFFLPQVQDLQRHLSDRAFLSYPVDQLDLNIINPWPERKGGGKLIHQQDPCMVGFTYTHTHTESESGPSFFFLQVKWWTRMMNVMPVFGIDGQLGIHTHTGQGKRVWLLRQPKEKRWRHAIASSVWLVVMAVMRGTPARVIVPSLHAGVIITPGPF